MDPTARHIAALLPAFAAFAETGRTTAAAELLQLPQSTISRSLARLGKELGSEVVARSGRELRLTPAGLALVPYAAAVVAAATDGVEAVRARDAAARGSIGLAFQGTLGERVVPALVKTFLREHPGVDFALLQLSRDGCLAALANGEAEFALISPLEERSGLTSLRLHVEPLVLVVPTGHRLATRARCELAAAAEEPFVCVKPGYGMRTILSDLAGAAGFTPAVAFEGDNLSTVRGLVSAGLGVAVAPRDPRGAHGFVEVPLVDPGAEREIGACWRAEGLNALGAAFRTLLRRRGRRLTEIGLLPYPS
ncbi:MAG: LysR family transcriptional regulator [Tetrasphaera sp.]